MRSEPFLRVRSCCDSRKGRESIFGAARFDAEWRGASDASEIEKDILLERMALRLFLEHIPAIQ